MTICRKWNRGDLKNGRIRDIAGNCHNHNWNSRSDYHVQCDTPPYGGMVRSYIIWIGSALILVIISTIFHMISTLNLFDETYPHLPADTFHILYHIFLIIGFIFFAIASYRLNKMSELYGFKEEGKHISQSTRKRPPRSH